MKKTTILILILTFLISSCKVIPITRKKFKPAKYVTEDISILQGRRIRHKYRCSLRTALVMVIDFKKDSTYNLALCNRVVSEKGKYKVYDDAIVMYDIYNYILGKKLINRTIPLDKTGRIIFSNYNIFGITTHKATVLYHKSKKVFDGVYNDTLFSPVDSFIIKKLDRILDPDDL